MDLLDPKNDLVFKLLLTRREELLLDMAQAILARPIREITIVDPTIPGELSTDKQIILDIRAVLADGSRADLEMQMRAPPVLAPRLLYYAARDYADQLHRGDEYHRLTPTVSIVWLVEPLFPQLDRLHSIFELRDRFTGTRFCDQLAIHLLQLSNLTPGPPAPATGYTAGVHRWARFLLARTRAEFDQLASEHSIMSTAKETLEQLSQDPEARRLAREREDSIKLYEMSLYASRSEGRAEGKAEVLLKQLRLRFGPLPDQARARLESATPEQLDDWTERVLTAATLDEVLAP